VAEFMLEKNGNELQKDSEVKHAEAIEHGLFGEMGPKDDQNKLDNLAIFQSSLKVGALAGWSLRVFVFTFKVLAIV
jgi:hypothetical protein